MKHHYLISIPFVLFLCSGFAKWINPSLPSQKESLSPAIIQAIEDETNCNPSHQPYFIHKFESDGGDAGQCSYLHSGVDFAPLGDWTRRIRIDTDNRSGGCLQQFAIVDPTGLLDEIELYVGFEGAEGQCHEQGWRKIPKNRSIHDIEWSWPIGIDADNRPGGCQQSFSLEGEGFALDIDFFTDEGGNNGQCKNEGQHTLMPYTTLSLGIDTDNRSGGCQQRFRLRQL